MLQATNILCYDDSIQSEPLKDSCMIAMLASITMVLHLIDMYLHNNKKSTRSSTTYHCIKCKRRTIQSLHQEYGSLFSRAYQMNYKGFMALHDLLQQGFKDYITNNNNCTNYTSPNNESSSFHVHNGDISSEIHLAVALRYFAGRSYLDISVSHGIRKTGVSQSVSAVHAMNTCAPLQFYIAMTIEECKAMADDFAFRTKAGFDNCVGCIDGMLLWTEKPFPKECERVGVDSGKFYCGTKCKFGLNLQGICHAHQWSHIFLSNIWHQLQIISHLLHHLCINN